MAKVSHLVLPVSDVRKSRDWYVDKLGFTAEREHEGVVGIKDRSGLITEKASIDYDGGNSISPSRGAKEAHDDATQ